MEQLLKTLQSLQSEAFKKGIHSFEVNARHGDDVAGYDTFLIATLFLRGDETKEDYLTVFFFGWDTDDETQEKIKKIRDFAGI